MSHGFLDPLRCPSCGAPAGTPHIAEYHKNGVMGPSISPLALIGDPPESRDHHGPGIPPEIHADARVEAFATIDAGTQRPTRLGASWAFKHSHIGHDAIVGDGCEIATGAIIGGWCEIGDNVRIGLGAVIRPRVKIGAGARVGMGAIVTKDVPADVTVIGNPAHDIEQNPSVDDQWYQWYKARDREAHGHA